MQRPFILGLVLIGALLLGAALTLHFVLDRRDQVASSEAPAAPGRPVAPSAGAGAAERPSFDIVRVAPSGDAVIAGRAAPGAAVELLDHGRVIGRVTADEHGEWVLVPSEPLASGHRELSLRSQRGDAPAETSDRVVALDLPEAAPGASRSAQTKVPGETPTGAASADASTVVEPGNSLWRLAERRYGRGTEYTAIFEANRAKIRDPDLIYPGQVFVMPPDR
jgi:nucleoid-associated protein YgaU